MSESKTIQVTATPEVLAEMAVRPARREDGALNAVTLHWPSGTYAGMVGRLPVEDPGASNPLAYVRAWLVGHIMAAYETGKAEGEKASKDDLGWHAAMGHVAQILGVSSADPKATEGRIRAEVVRLKDSADAFAAGADVAGLRARIADLTAEVEGVRADMAKELAKALQMTHLVPWDVLLEEARDLAAADVDGLREKIKDLTDDVERLTAENDVLKRVACEVERLTAENNNLRDKSPAGPYASGFLEARRRVWEYLDNREERLSSARKEAERLHRESATADKQVAILSGECAALQEALDAIGEVTES